jgi:hypothetical protein
MDDFRAREARKSVFDDSECEKIFHIEQKFLRKRVALFQQFRTTTGK